MRISRHPLKQFLFLLLLLPAFAVAEQQAEIPELKPQPQQALVEQLVATYTSRLHFASRELDDKLSSEVFERYLEMLDPSKVYFTRDDIAGFEKHRHVIDDALKSGRVDVAYDIYNTLLKRMVERIASIDVLLQKEPDFSVDEYFEFDRRDADWQTAAELDEYWRKRIKNEALGLMLADKTWDETRELLSKRYSNFRRRVAQVNSGDVFDLFINAYAQTLDPHTMYFSPRDSEEFEIRMSLSYEGIGASLQMEDEYVTIMNTIPGGAAHRSGELKPKDRITAVGEGDDGEMTDVVGWRLDEVVDLIRGPKDTVVRLQILPAGAAPGTSERVISLVRSEIKLEEQAAQASVLEVPEREHSRKLGVIKVPAFYLDFRGKVSGREDYRSTTRDVRRLIGELKEKGVDGLILDLRYNGGGSLQEAAELTGLFIDQGPVVQIRASAGPKEVIEDVEPGVAWDGPLVVLVNRFSASASEIFAGAIQDYGRGLVVGTRTFGKGTVQHLVDLNRMLNTETDLGQLKMTIGMYYRVNGASTQHRGVVPDIELPSELDIDSIGESSQPTALPWDEIEPVGKIREVGIAARDLLPKMREEVSKRQQEDELFRLFVDDLRELNRLRDETRVSLQIEKRQKEQAERDALQLERINKRRLALGLAEVKSLEEAAEAEEEHDLVLQEAGRILRDYLVELTPADRGQRLAAGASP